MNALLVIFWIYVYKWTSTRVFVATHEAIIMIWLRDPGSSIS